MDNGLKFFGGLGLEVLANENLFNEEVSNLANHGVTTTLLAVDTKEKKLVTLQKSDLSIWNWISSFFSSKSPLANKDYHLENVVHYTKEKIDEALKNGDGTDEYKKLKTVAEKIDYLKSKGMLNANDLKILKNIYNIANRAYFYNHDKDGLFDAVSKTINNNKTPSITVFQGDSLTPTAIRSQFKWNSQMTTRFLALEALKEGKIRTYKPLSQLNIRIGFETNLAIPKKLNQPIDEKDLVKDGSGACIKFLESSGGDYIEECFIAAKNNPKLFELYDSDTKVEVALKLYEKNEKIPYERLTTDQMIALIDKKPEILNRIPEKYYEEIIKQTPKFLLQSKNFRNKFFEDNPERIKLLPLPHQKVFLYALHSTYNEDEILKKLLPLAAEEAQIYIIEQLGDQNDGVWHDYVSPKIYFKILGGKLEELAKKSDIFQKKALAHEENIKIFLKYADEEIQKDLLKQDYDKNLPYVDSKIQMKEIEDGTCIGFFKKKTEQIALFSIDFQKAIIQRLRNPIFTKELDTINQLMSYVGKDVQRHFSENKDILANDSDKKIDNNK